VRVHNVIGSVKVLVGGGVGAVAMRVGNRVVGTGGGHVGAPVGVVARRVGAGFAEFIGLQARGHEGIGGVGGTAREARPVHGGRLHANSAVAGGLFSVSGVLVATLNSRPRKLLVNPTKLRKVGRKTSEWRVPRITIPRCVSGSRRS